MTKDFATTFKDERVFVRIENGIVSYANRKNNKSGFGVSSVYGKMFEDVLKHAFTFMCEHDPKTLESILNEIHDKDPLHYELGCSILNQGKKQS